MAIAFPWYQPVMRIEKTYVITLNLDYRVMVGHAVEIEGEPYIVMGIEHHISRYPKTQVTVAEPNWWWKAKYKLKRFLGRIARPFKAAWRRLRS